MGVEQKVKPIIVNQDTVTGNDDKSELEVNKIAIDKSLFSYFSPEFAAENRVIPISVDKKSEDKPLARQEWILRIAVAQSHYKDFVSHADYYAEQIRIATKGFWPGHMTLSVIATTDEQIDRRLPQIKQLWDMRVMEEELRVPLPMHEVVQPELKPVDELAEAINMLRGSFTEATQTAIENISGTSVMRAEQIVDLRKQDRSSNIRALQSLLNVAILKGASDIHLQYVSDGSEAPKVLIRLRIDGVLQDLIDTYSSLGPSILNILGTCAGGGVEETAFHLRPQDGKMVIWSKDGRRFDGRLAFRPVTVTSSSFNCTIRLLDSTQAFEFDKLDLTKRNKETLEWAMGLDHGMIVLTGPTGSGKSSTIQACLRKIISPEIKVVTIEDPVEYLLKDAEQIQVNPKDPDMSFPACLRSVLRADPDVIFVGEIRDAETAHTAIQAALTGHLVFTTVHAESALHAVDRIVDLGVHRSLVANALAVVGAQRLVRRIVPERWEMGETTLGDVEQTLRVKLARDDEHKKQKIKIPILKEEYKHGDNDNYKGRIAVHQYHAFSDELRDGISAGQTSRQLYPIARRGGMRTLVEDALIKVQDGMTSLEEVAMTLRGA